MLAAKKVLKHVEKTRACFIVLVLTTLAACIPQQNIPTPIPLPEKPQPTAYIQPTVPEKSPTASPLPTPTIPWLPSLEPITPENITKIRELDTLGAYSTALAISPDEKWLASGSLERKLRLWSLVDGSLAQTLEPVENPGQIWALQFSHDGGLLAMGSGDGKIRIWQVPEGSLLYTLEGHARDVRSLAFSPDDLTLASGSNDQMIAVWETSTGKLIRMLGWNPGYVRAVTYSPDGQWLASGSGLGSLRFWDNRGVLRHDVVVHSDDITTLAFSPDGKMLAVGAHNHYICLFGLPGFERLINVQAHADQINSLVFSPDGLLLASGSEDKTIAFWNVNPAPGQFLEEQQRLSLPEDARASALVFSPDGTLLISASMNGDIILWGIPQN